MRSWPTRTEGEQETKEDGDYVSNCDSFIAVEQTSKSFLSVRF